MSRHCIGSEHDVWKGFVDELNGLIRLIPESLPLLLNLLIPLVRQRLAKCVWVGRKGVGKALQGTRCLLDAAFVSEDLANEFDVFIIATSQLGHKSHLMALLVQANNHEPLLVRDAPVSPLVNLWVCLCLY